MLAAALAAAALTAGCQESGFDESKETVRPLKVQDSVGPLGGTKVPGQAERPLTLNTDALGDTLALGVRPVLAALPDDEYLRTCVRGPAASRSCPRCAVTTSVSPGGRSRM